MLPSSLARQNMALLASSVAFSPFGVFLAVTRPNKPQTSVDSAEAWTFEIDPRSYAVKPERKERPIKVAV